jgi:hypothetical protein
MEAKMLARCPIAPSAHDEFMQVVKKELDNFERKEREFCREERQEKADWLEAITKNYLEKKALADR